MPRGAQVAISESRLASGRRACAVTIEGLTEPTTAGYPVETWTARLPVVYMNRLDVRADERFASNQPSAFIETTWQMPYRADMDPDLVDVPKARRLVYKGRYYDIRAATPIRDGIELLTLAGSRVS